MKEFSSMKTRIEELIDFGKIDTLLEGFNKSTGFVTAILDLKGNVLSQSGWRSICTDFHRVNPHTSKNCTYSDTVLAGKMAADQKYHFYKCLNGLVDVAVPIIIHGEHIANLFSGQFFFEAPDKEAFINQAHTYGFNKADYLEALKKVPVLSEEKVKIAMDFLLQMTQFISELAVQKSEMAELADKLRESERRLTLATNHPSMIIAQSDRSLRYTWIPNPHSDFEAMNVIGKRDDEIADNEATRQLMELKKRVLETGRGERIEIAFPLSNGLRTFDIIAEPIFDHNGQVAEVSTFSLDITDRKQIEQAFKRSEERFRLAQEISPDGFTILHPVCDEKGMITDFEWVYENKTIATINGTDPEDVVGKRLLELFPSHKGTSLFEAYLNVARTGKTEIFNDVYIGEIISKPTWLRIVIFSMGDDIGILAHNITDRKLAEEALRESNEYLDNLFNYANAPIIVWDKAYKITRFNQAFEELTGRKSQDVLGTHIGVLFPDESREASIELINKALSGEFWKVIEIKIAHLSGKTSTVIWNSANVKHSDGTIIATIAQGQDITERKAAEEALRESEERFKSLHNASFGGIAIHNKGIILDCNQGLSVMTGYTVDELIGMDGMRLIASASRAEVMRNIQSGYELPYEVTGIRKNGDEYPLRLEARNIHYKGKPVRTVEFRDITEIKRVEKELITAKETAEKNEEKFRKAVLVIPDAITINRLSDGVYVTANEGFYRIFAYTENEVIGKTSGDLKIWLEPEQRKTYIELLEQKGTIENFEAKFISKTGQVFDCLVSSSIILIDGEAHTINITKDITHLKNIESQLTAAKERAEESELKFREMARLLPQIIFETDTQGRLTYANKQAHEMLGYADDFQFIGLNTLDFYIPEDQARAKENIRRKLTGSDETNNEYTMVRKDGSLINVLVSSTPIVKDNKLIGLRGVIVDITQRKKAEEALKESEKLLRELNAQKDKFFTIISHDLKSPFNAIYALSQHLVDQMKEKDYEGVEEYAKIIEQSSERAMNLLMNLLQWSQAQTGRIVFEPEHFELVRLIDESIRIIEDVARNKSIAIKYQLPNHLLVHADRQMLSSILRNLVNNAIKFSMPGSEVLISAERIQSAVKICIKDHGVGIPKERLDKLFRIDEAESTRGTANEKGTGLGLILCKEFVEKHGGSIWVESKQGHGTSFYFTLPFFHDQ